MLSAYKNRSPTSSPLSTFTNPNPSELRRPAFGWFQLETVPVYFPGIVLELRRAAPRRGHRRRVHVHPHGRGGAQEGGGQRQHA
mmetsp:Transcript_101064/g.263531  ORF Transcript_101064/g.263531 Transcript_101064/m.263531 type:complete len:84 (-) Transcript_101064:8-259(-)